MLCRRLRRDQHGVAAIEMAFALPILIMMIWMIVQLAQVYRALAGIQQGLGEGARYATLCLTPTATGCTIPTGSAVSDRIKNAVYGIGPGTFKVNPNAAGVEQVPVVQTDAVNGGSYYDLSVTYTQPTNLLLAPGPTISVRRSKRVWVATS
jgi:Flp pilus assembly protein TadG